MDRILIVEDEDVIRQALKRLLERNGYEIEEVSSVADAKQLNIDSFSLVISDLKLPGAPGTDLISLSNTPVLIMTSYASVRSAIDSMKMGAIDYIAKPFEHAEMLDTVTSIINKYRKTREAGNNPTGQTAIKGMIGSCHAMQVLSGNLKKVAPTTSTVLILGETGTGKELIAKSIHQLSDRANKPLICVNCAAIPETLIESELFGYDKGAFTGANTNRMGLVEAADSGTLFLDEIGELPPEAQARLLRFIQEGEIRRIGATQSREVDVRLICATHRDLLAMSQQGNFRADLYYRINVIRLELPPLRERGKDVIDIAQAFLARLAGKFDKSGLAFSPEAIQAIGTYSWPGNIRELENAIERAVILADSEEIGNELLGIDLELIEVGPSAQDDEDDTPSKPKSNKSEPIEDLSLEEYFQHFILEHQEKMSETELARKLGISRKSLWERRKRLGIPRSTGKSSQK